MTMQNEPQKGIMKKMYCIEIERELEEVMVVHHYFEDEPTRKDVLDYIETLDCGYDDNYGRITYYEVKAE